MTETLLNCSFRFLKIVRKAILGRGRCCILGLSCSLPYLGMPIYGEPRVKVLGVF